jgi:8-oxo-dGTP diphosphatase
VRQEGVIVVAALIQDKGRLLICQRRRDQRHPLKWEFPGGKVEPGEPPREALKRELSEELEIEATIGPEIVRYEHRYPANKPILLIFYLVNEFRGALNNRIFARTLWESPAQLPSYDFLDGDIDFVRRLARGEFLGVWNGKAKEQSA